MSNNESLPIVASTDWAALKVVILLDNSAAAAVRSVLSKPDRSSLRLVAEVASVSAALLSRVSRTPMSDCASEMCVAAESSESSEVLIAADCAVASGLLSAAIAAFMMSARLLVDPSLSVTEPNTGTVAATFKVSLSAPSTNTVTVHYATSVGTAKVGDFQSRSGTLTFPPGQVSANVVVPVVGDTVREANETYKVTLSLPTNSGLGSATATGTIVNND